MKATFEFSLPDETADYLVYHRAPDYHVALGEFREWLRQRRKHGKDTFVLLDTVWDEFHRICEEFVNDL